MNIDIKLHFNALVIMLLAFLFIAGIVWGFALLCKAVIASPVLGLWLVGIFVVGVAYSVALDVAKANRK